MLQASTARSQGAVSELNKSVHRLQAELNKKEYELQVGLLMLYVQCSYTVAYNV